MQTIEQNSKPKSDVLEVVLMLVIGIQHANGGVSLRFGSMFCGCFHERANRSRRSASSKYLDGWQKKIFCISVVGA